MSQDRDSFWESEDVMTEQEADQVMGSIGQQEELGEEDAAENFEDGVEVLEEEYQEDLEVLKNARLRLEQGKLYELLLKHDLFEGVEADKRAVINVQKEVRAFVKERLEILVGLKPDPKLSPVKNTNLGIFSEEELLVLKGFVGKVVKNQIPDQKPSAAAPKQQGLKPVRSNQNVRINPVKEKARPVQSTQKPEPPSSGLQKPPSEMTAQELLEYNKGISARQANRKAAQPTKKVAMPDANQLQTLYAGRVNTDPGQTLVGAIMAKMGKSVSVIENVGDGGVEDTSNDSRI